MSMRPSPPSDSTVHLTGLQLLSSIRYHHPFETGHRSLDEAIWNRPVKSGAQLPAICGLSKQQHLQIEGPPGVGKTKLAIGIAVRARAKSLISKRHDEEVETLFIDADGSSGSQLIAQTALSFAEMHYEKESVIEMTTRICDGIHSVRITSAAELGFFFRKLPQWLECYRKVKLIILDSITAHTRYVSMSITERSCIARIVKDSMMLASSDYACAIVVTTQLTVRTSNDAGSVTEAIMVPPDFKANLWSNSTMWRIILKFNPDASRKASVLTDETCRTNVVYAINASGIYDPTLSAPH